MIYGAQTQSIAGDQLARVALSVFVFERTNSAALTALTYGVTYLPALLGGVVLARIGDRIPRHDVMVLCDLARAPLFLAMAVSDLPWIAAVALLVVAVFIGPAFSAASVSYLSTELTTDQFRAATGLRLITSQVAQAAGFAVGGVLVAAISPRGALVVDAASYVVSAIAIGFALRRDTVSAPTDKVARSRAEPLARLAREPWRRSRVRQLVGLSLLAGFFVVPEGLAVPYGRGINASTTEIGLLLASIPLGSVIGIVLFVRIARHSREAVAMWMAVGCGIPLVATVLRPPWPISVALWLASGALAAYQVEMMTSIVYAVPKEVRSRFVGVVNALLLGAQGIGIAAFGGIAHLSTPARAIALAGALGTALAAAVAFSAMHRSEREDLQVSEPRPAQPMPRPRPTPHAYIGRHGR